MRGRVEALGTRIRLSGPAESELGLSDDVRAKWVIWTDRYRSATLAGGAEALLALGREMFDWLDAGGWARAWAGRGGSRRLEICGDAPETADQRAMLSLPWELLADDSGHLAGDAVQPFLVWRRVGPPVPPVPPAHRDLSLLFMAAAPLGVEPELAFEAEEAAILQATQRLPPAELARPDRDHEIVHVSAAGRRAALAPTRGSRVQQAPQGYEDFDKGAAKKYVLDPHGLITKSG